MSRDTELDLLAADTQSLLADTVVTVWAMRPASAYDPVTRKRAYDRDAPHAPGVRAIVDDDQPQRSGDKHARRRAWIVLAADLPFVPSRDGIVEEHGERWRIVEAARMTDRRDWRIVGERID